MSSRQAGDMRIRRVTVTLGGATNDKDVLRAAMRMAAQDRAELRVYMATSYSRELYERHVDFARWDVEQLGLEPPAVEPVLLEA